MANRREKVKVVTELLFLGSESLQKSGELASSQESYDKPRECVEKQRYYSANKVHIVKAIVFPVVMYSYESWMVKKAECQRIEELMPLNWVAGEDS